MRLEPPDEPLLPDDPLFIEPLASPAGPLPDGPQSSIPAGPLEALLFFEALLLDLLECSALLECSEQLFIPDSLFVFELPEVEPFSRL